MMESDAGRESDTFDRQVAVEAFRRHLLANRVVNAPSELTGDDLRRAIFGSDKPFWYEIGQYLGTLRRGKQRLFKAFIGWTQNSPLNPILSRLIGKTI
ncbi:hypothetical protein A3C26_00100 [Candidatus Daviesbacteria bacterium RIFCSPHIGHO2_02_FULL_39_12]|uniref:Uncharacterized protein n=2 Tax=Candidatus Daviesiibacteriota TaxID=1752718 RepID=A0A1F5JBU1_9BACT|nr:MAG: hypothetical protein A3C26_00100 [Candidatus Daviesbacteria bacterium RIFCSPHIGHO2_02_FULL_39_12]OGE71360.1 MAG: hypothetical protein A3H40_03650 [Candidatus Daviesbacteria bacterium RIFCSPLOWO2_02_FULL_38_15]